MPACKRDGCPFVRLRGEHRWHGFCCNACRRGDGCHTRNCTGSRCGDRSPDPRPVALREFVPTFHIPHRWACGDSGGGVEFLEHIFWYIDRFDLNPSYSVKRRWFQLLPTLRDVHIDRNLTLNVVSERAGTNFQFREGINVNLGTCSPHHLDSRHPMIPDQKLVTGIDFEIQAVLLLQANCANVLENAIAMIEAKPPHQHFEFTFMCRSATHRSVACAILLASLVYRTARIRLSTPRTMTRAVQVGMTRCD